MSGRRAAVLGTIVLAVTLSVAAPAAARDDFRSGVWEGRAHPRNGGPFTGCSIDAEYENGIALTFWVSDRYELGLLLFSRAWSLTKGDSYPVAYSVHGSQRVTATAQAYDRHTVYIALPSTRETFDRMRSGRTLLVEAAGGQFRFDLGGTYTALELLLACVERNLRSAGIASRNPYAGGGAPQRPEPRGQRADRPPQDTPRRPPRVSPDERAAAAAFVEKLLLRAELYSYEILTGERVPGELREFHVVWQGYHVLGMLDILPRGTFRTVDEAAGVTVAASEKQCDGKLSSRGEALRLDDGRRLIQLAIVCAGKERTQLDYTIMPVAQGGFYRILHLSAEDPEAGRVANQRIGRALLAMLSE